MKFLSVIAGGFGTDSKNATTVSEQGEVTSINSDELIDPSLTSKGYDNTVMMAFSSTTAM